MTSIAEAMEKAATAARPYSNRLGSAVIQDIGQDAVLAFWQASERGEELDIVAEVTRRAKREEWHARPDQGAVIVPLEDVTEWMPTTNDSGEFGSSVVPTPGVRSITPRELMMEAALAADVVRPVLGWLDEASAQARARNGKAGRNVSLPKPLIEAVSAELPAVLAWWGHRTRTRQADDWKAARAMSPTTEHVASPAELSDAEVSYYAREGKPRRRPTPIKVHTNDPEADGMAILSFGPGRVNKPSRGGKREGQATVALGGRNRWADVGNRAG